MPVGHAVGCVLGWAGSVALGCLRLFSRSRPPHISWNVRRLLGGWFENGFALWRAQPRVPRVAVPMFRQKAITACVVHQDKGPTTMNVLSPHAAFHDSGPRAGRHRGGVGFAGLLGGAGMLGMFRIHGMSQQFMHHSFAEVTHLAELRGKWEPFASTKRT